MPKPRVVETMLLIARARLQAKLFNPATSKQLHITTSTIASQLRTHAPPDPEKRSSPSATPKASPKGKAKSKAKAKVKRAASKKLPETEEPAETPSAKKRRK